MRQFYVYIMASRSRTLYIGITSDLQRRVFQHKHKQIPGFTSKYNIVRLVYFEQTTSAIAAITLEKQLKGWRRQRKVDLFEESNPDWDDLSEIWRVT